VFHEKEKLTASQGQTVPASFPNIATGSSTWSPQGREKRIEARKIDLVVMVGAANGYTEGKNRYQFPKIFILMFGP